MNQAKEDASFFDLVGDVRAMRRLKTDPVPMSLMMKVLNAGVQAPSGQNLQPWRFLLLNEPEKKEWFASNYTRAIESRFKFNRKDSQTRPPGRQLLQLVIHFLKKEKPMREVQKEKALQLM